MQKQIIGKTALEIINTLVRENLVSSLQHAGDLGIELCKAELALKYDLKYMRPLHETAPLLEAYHQTEKKQRMAMK